MYSSRVGLLLLAVFTACLALGASIAFAAADSKSHFDLPAEPLDKALQGFAIQAHCQISYDPSLVSGIQAPPLKGEFTRADALSVLLKGTNLKAVNIDQAVIRVIGKGVPASRETTSETSSGNASGGLALLAVDGSNANAVAKTAPGSDRTASGTGDDKPRDRDLEEIIVTGTHIRGLSIASSTIEIGREEIDRSGYTSTADLMLSLPQNFGGGYNAATMVNNSQVNRYADNPTGASVPNLRGLGPGSTLTLVDGHRMAAGLTGGGADIASIPIDAIERIEVLTDSASAIYGSDAVAGVVNVILKRDYDGADTSLSYGLSTDGGGTEKRASQLFGKRWDGGSASVAYEHRQQDTVDARDRSFASSALEPNSLLPRTKGNSITLSAMQDLSTTIAVFVDGLYIARNADHFTSTPYSIAPAESPSTLRKYAVAAGLNFNLMHEWNATVLANAAEDATDDNAIFLTRPARSAAAERLFGTMRSVEATANGEIATLPSGIARLALGAGYRKEGFSDALGTSSASLYSTSVGDRNIRYAFGELSIPVVRHSERPGLNALDLVVSGRTERYSDFGTKTVPKVGLVYVPTGSIKLRATWGKAFRAPNLYDANAVRQLVILNLPNTTSSTGSSTSLIRAGGNPNLQPETAESWSIGSDYSAPELGLQVSTTLFHVKYTNRIASIDNAFTALTNPLNEYFVTASPSSGLAQSVYNEYPPRQIFNATRFPFDPSKIGAIVDDRMVNVASQTARGADLNVNYRIGAGSSNGLVFLNATYLDLQQRNTPQAAEQALSGLAFYPAKFRTRSGATWSLDAWSLTGTVNYLPSETNNQVTPFQNVGSWTTVDASLRFAPKLPRIFSGMHFTLAVMNVLDRDPPFVRLPPSVPQGFNYDSANTTPLGRFVSLQISKVW